MQINIVIDGISEVCQLTGTSIVEDKILCQSGICLTHVEVFVGHAVDGLFASNLHARPVTIQIIRVAPHVKIQSVPSRLVVHKDSIAIVLDAGFQFYFLHAISGDAQIDIVVEREVEVRQL